MVDKLDNMCMAFVLHGLYKDFEYVQNQILTNPNVTTTNELIGLLRVPHSEAMSGVGSHPSSESPAFLGGLGGRACG